MTDKKAEIFRCGKALFEEKGFKDTNVAEIMRRAGYATGSFYRYYPSKDPSVHGDLQSGERGAETAHPEYCGYPRQPDGRHAAADGAEPRRNGRKIRFSGSGTTATPFIRSSAASGRRTRSTTWIFLRRGLPRLCGFGRRRGACAAISARI